MSKNGRVSREGILMSGAIRIVSPLISNLKLERKRSGHDLLGVIRGIPKSLTSSKAEGSPIPAEWIKNEASSRILPDEVTILFVHGGSYLTGSLIGSRPVAGLLCELSGVNTLTFEYRLAPENVFPAALEDAIAIWDYLVGTGIEPNNIVVAGESAGGGLAMALGLALRDRGREMPAGFVCISAWADLTETSPSHTTRAKQDILLSSDDLRAAAVKYSAGESLKNPYLSPVFGEFSGFPPVLIHVGSREVLYDDSHKLYEKLSAAGIPVKLSVYDGMWHVWHGYDIPESRKAINEIRDFIYDVTGHGSMVPVR